MNFLLYHQFGGLLRKWCFVNRQWNWSNKMINIDCVHRCFGKFRWITSTGSAIPHFKRTCAILIREQARCTFIRQLGVIISCTSYLPSPRYKARSSPRKNKKVRQLVSLFLFKLSIRNIEGQRFRQNKEVHICHIAAKVSQELMQRKGRVNWGYSWLRCWLADRNFS